MPAFIKPLFPNEKMGLALLRNSDRYVNVFIHPRKGNYYMGPAHISRCNAKIATDPAFMAAFAAAGQPINKVAYRIVVKLKPKYKVKQK